MKKKLVMFVSHDCKSMDPLSVSGYNNILGYLGPGQKLLVTIEKFSEKRSLEQNGLLHKYFTIISQETGYDPAEVKELMKMKFGEREDVLDREGNIICDEGTGEILKKMKSTSDYTKAEMTNFIDLIRMFSMEVLGCYLPTPDEMANINP